MTNLVEVHADDTVLVGSRETGGGARASSLGDTTLGGALGGLGALSRGCARATGSTGCTTIVTATEEVTEQAALDQARVLLFVGSSGCLVVGAGGGSRAAGTASAHKLGDGGCSIDGSASVGLAKGVGVVFADDGGVGLCTTAWSVRQLA